MDQELQPELKAEQEFSFYINKAYVDNDSQQMRWCAVNSDTDEDSYKDQMSLELYEDFLSRIANKELPPERHRSDYWSGGIPYLSVAHYLDLNGDGVPGTVDDIYVDGNKLKSRGTFYNTVLGKAAYAAVRENFQEKSDKQKVRISIAFVDHGHQHRSSGYEFIRQSLDDICPECLKEMIEGKSEGRVFKRGHLIHLALTRVPVNKRTIILEERSMTTQLEDAASILGEENAEKLEALKAEMKSEATELVVKSDPVEDEAEEEKKKKEMKEEEKSEVVVEETVELSEVKETPKHVLAVSIDNFLASYNEVAKADLGYQDKLQQVQDAYAALGEAVKSSFAPTPEEKKVEELGELKSLVIQMSEQLQSMTQELSILKQERLQPPTKLETQPVVRRSMTLESLQQQISNPAQANTGSSLRDISRRSVGLNH